MDLKSATLVGLRPEKASVASAASPSAARTTWATRVDALRAATART